MDWQVLITDEALDDLRRIVDFIARDDPDAAEQMGQRLITRSLELVTMPERHPIYDAALGIRKFSVLPYLIFYRCNTQVRTVRILHFWHSARRRPRFR